MKIRTSDTIAAVATPAGEGAIAVIRISGPDAIAVADRTFRGRTKLAGVMTQTVHHGMIVNLEGETVDEGLATVFRGPHSYTGEDVVEVSCHGGIYVTNAVLAAVLGGGARQADPGEFTRRAFLNRKMDLSRAEAVASLISSTGARAHRASLEQLNGRLAGTIGEIRDGMARLCALLEIDLDFSEEGIELIGRGEIERNIREMKDRLETIAGTFKTGRLYRDGVSVVIVGKPNVGKSSLFNALLKESRAIVTPIAGTTRDFLEESILLGGVLFRLTDTAGLRESDDPIESEGIKRSRMSVENADIVLIVDDASGSPTPRGDLLRESRVGENHYTVIVRNKIDLATGRLPGKGTVDSSNPKWGEVSLSASSGEGVHLLAGVLEKIVAEAGITSHESVQLTSRRHWESVAKASAILTTALKSLSSGTTNEFVAFDVREAAGALGEITGELTSEEVINSIFESFCIGK